MRSTQAIVPYASRKIQIADGFSLVWPFANLGISEGPYELLLDNNALINSKWALSLPRGFREASVVNPWPALVEQWISNSELRKEPAKKIERLVSPLVDVGFRFERGYADKQVETLISNEAQIRAQCSTLFPYVAIMKSFVSDRPDVKDTFEALSELSNSDLPRFTGCIMLAALTALLRSRQSLKLKGDENRAYSYLESFLSFQPRKKHSETIHINIPYLRNRAGDLLLWYMASLLRQQGYLPAGELVVVTSDQVLCRLILKVLPPFKNESGCISFVVAPDAIDDETRFAVEGVVENARVRPDATFAERSRRMTALFDFAKRRCKLSAEHEALDVALNEWWLPGCNKAWVIH